MAEGRDVAKTHVYEVMTRGIVTCGPTDDLQRALDAMTTHQVRRIPVVDEDQHVIGIITQADVATRLQEPETTADLVKEISKPGGTSELTSS